MSSPFACSSSSRCRTRGGSRLGGGRGALRALVLALALVGCKHAAAGTSLTIEVPQEDLDADLFVDGQYVGQVGAVGKEPVGPVELAPGVHRVEVRKPGRFPVQRTVKVDNQTPAETVIEAELLEDPQ
jgi:hypothetical protein